MHPKICQRKKKSHSLSVSRKPGQTDFSGQRHCAVPATVQGLPYFTASLERLGFPKDFPPQARNINCP